MTAESVGVPLIIHSCRDCPRLNITEAHHWMLGNQKGYEYMCTQASRNIYPSEGVTPPPKWCPKRKETL